MSDSASDSTVDDGGGTAVSTPAANAAPVVGTVTPGAADGGVPDGLTQIDDEDVPLAVIDDEDDNTGTELVGVDEEEVPLANPAVDRIWWSWIPIIAPIASAIDGYRKDKKDKKESDSKKED